MTLSRAGIRQFWRFAGAAIINTIFGYGLWALMVRVGVNIYVAQVLAQIAGVLFNFQTYKRAFHDAEGSRVLFVLAYVGNYATGVLLLALYKLVIPSVYVAGFITVLTAALINFFILKRFVFVRRERTA